MWILSTPAWHYTHTITCLPDIPVCFQGSMDKPECTCYRQWLALEHGRAGRELMLRELDFEFEEEEAHWLRWYGELKRLYDAQGPGYAINFASSTDLFLSHW